MEPSPIPAIRKALPADAEAIAVLSATVWVGTYVADGIHPDVARYISTEFSPRQIASRIADPARHWVVAALDGRIIGYAHVNYAEACPASATHDAELVNLYVLEACTGRGTGTQLLREAERVAVARGKRLWLSVNSRNERAAGFYRRRGYCAAGELYFQLGGERYKNDILRKAFHDHEAN